MTEMQFIQIGISAGIARITLNRPKHNVFNIDMIKEFNSALATVARKGDLKCVVIAGEGKSWCAGVDVGDHKPEMVDEMIHAFGESFQLINRIKVPTVAAVHGACLGGGMEYAIACDVIIAAENAAFGQPEVRLGFLPPYAAIRLPELIGPAKAIEVCTTGKIYSAAEAQQLGFVSRVVSQESFDEALQELLKSFQASSPLILRLNKKAVKSHLKLDFDAALSEVNDLFLTTLMKTEDTLEGIASFYERRKPEWKNR
jgi:cyclohexa-1,5-dienecarbonyl-CoA hydratase